MREWKKNNPEKAKLIHERRLVRLRETGHASTKLWQQKNREKWLAYCRKLQKAFVEKNRPYYRALWANQRAMRKNADGRHTKQQISELFAKQRGSCADCGKNLEKYHVDHITPLSKGGSNAIYNLQLLCPSCNLRKSDKDPIIHAQSLGRLL
jgi:5-methylcytosine-specific restriction endonuclease McrA